MTDTATIEQAKAERLTLERLAMNARRQLFNDNALCQQSLAKALAGVPGKHPYPDTNWQLLIDAYCRSIVSLNSIIRLAEMQESERKL